MVEAEAPERGLLALAELIWVFQVGKWGYTMGRFVNIGGVSFEVVRVNFQGRSGMWSALYRTDSGSEALGWFAASQFTDVELAPRPVLRQGC